MTTSIPVKLKRVNIGSDDYPLYAYEYNLPENVVAPIHGVEFEKFRVVKRDGSWSILGSEVGSFRYVTLEHGVGTKKSCVSEIEFYCRDSNLEKDGELYVS